VATVHHWTGLEAKALRLALRLSVRAFAQQLGLAVATVSKWESKLADTEPRPDTQAILDTALGRADASVHLERRSFATARKLWPDVEILCASEPLEFDDYLKSIGDEKLVLDMLVGDLQRVIEYPKLGFAIEQEVPEDVHAAYESLIRDGFTSRLISS